MILVLFINFKLKIYDKYKYFFLFLKNALYKKITLKLSGENTQFLEKKISLNLFFLVDKELPNESVIHPKNVSSKELV